MLPFGPPPAAPPMPMGAGPMDPLAMTPSPMLMPPPVQDDTIGIDPQMIIQMLTQMAPTFKPIYPPNYQKPKRPNPQAVWQQARIEEGRNQRWIQSTMDTIARLRFDVVGIFPRDKIARDIGDQDQMVLSDLVDDWQLLSAIGSSFDLHFTKRTLQRHHQIAGQTLEDFAAFMAEEEEYRWANTGDMPLPMAKWKTLTSYGRIVSRHLCNLDDPEYPFDDMLIDPASCYFVPGGTKGPSKVYRMMRMTYAQAFAEWGEPTKAAKDKLSNKYGTDNDTLFTDVCEYADTWYRGALIEGGIELLPVTTEHKYGYLPFIMQGGPGGEPLFTDTAQASAIAQNRLGGSNIMSGPMDDWGLQHKLTSSIKLQQNRHDQLEALMSRVATAISDSDRPALIAYEDVLGGSKVDPIDHRPGKMNHVPLGAQIVPVPREVAPMDVQSFMQAASQDKLTGAIPLGMYGQQTGSQQTGNSMSVAAETGMDHITPWVKTMETYETRKAEMKIRSWRNWGHLTRFQNGEEKMFVVPSLKPKNANELGQIVTPELIDGIGPRVSASLTRIRTQELMQLTQMAATAVPLGIISKRRMAEKMGEHDYDRMREESLEEQEWDAIETDPQMRVSVKIPMRIKQYIDQSIDPEEKAFYMAMLDQYMEQQQMQAQQQAQQQSPMPGGPMAPGGPPSPMGGPPPAPGAPIGAGSNTMNQAGLGLGPGSQGDMVGRPQVGPPPF